jgi:ribonuclease HII
MQICGIDEAGRGSMLGPLVIAGISLDKKNLRKLSSLGVKDSKKLSPKLR